MNKIGFDLTAFGAPVGFFLPCEEPQFQKIGIIFRKDNLFQVCLSPFTTEFYPAPSLPPCLNYSDALKRAIQYYPEAKFLESASNLEDLPVLYGVEPKGELVACLPGDFRLKATTKGVRKIPARKIPPGTELGKKVQLLFFLARGPGALSSSSAIRLTPVKS